jgi:hypothetical protein
MKYKGDKSRQKKEPFEKGKKRPVPRTGSVIFAV